MPAVTRRAFLKLTALLASAAAALRFGVARAALPPGCEPQVATAIPTAIPTAIGAECVYRVYLPQVER